MTHIAPGGFADDFTRKLCMRSAGPYFEEMRHSETVAWDYLNHPDPQARLGALAMLRDYWKPSAAFGSACEKMALEDSELNVRCLALNCLINIYYGSRDPRIARQLALFVRDEAQPLLFRKLAYCILFAVQGVRNGPLPPTCQFPETVNWSFVDKFL